MVNASPAIRFVQNFTPPEFPAKTFTPSISTNFNSFSDKTQIMSENREIYTAWQKFYTAAGSDGRDKSQLWPTLHLFFPPAAPPIFYPPFLQYLSYYPHFSFLHLLLSAYWVYNQYQYSLLRISNIMLLFFAPSLPPSLGVFLRAS